MTLGGRRPTRPEGRGTLSLSLPGAVSSGGGGAGAAAIRACESGVIRHRAKPWRAEHPVRDAPGSKTDNARSTLGD